jgi:hypothetical protein
LQVMKSNVTVAVKPLHMCYEFRFKVL